MLWFLIVVLGLVALALAAVFVLAAMSVDEPDDELARIEMEVRRAERRLQPWWVERVCSALASPASGRLRAGLSGGLGDDLYASGRCSRQ
jgi:hypothetical protein